MTKEEYRLWTKRWIATNDDEGRILTTKRLTREWANEKVAVDPELKNLMDKIIAASDSLLDADFELASYLKKRMGEGK